MLVHWSRVILYSMQTNKYHNKPKTYLRIFIPLILLFLASSSILRLSSAFAAICCSRRSAAASSGESSGAFPLPFPLAFGPMISDIYF